MEEFFDQEFLARLEHLSLQTRRIRAGQHSGERRSPHKGSSVEFADFRNYSIGDDFRHIDWNAYARTEKLFLKLFMEEQDLLLNIFIDVSQSMEWGDPPKNRLVRQLAGAFAYLALASYDRVAVGGCSDGLDYYLPPVRGRSSLARVWDFVAGLPIGGKTDLNQALRDYGQYARGPGVALVLSDFLSPGGFRDGIKYLQYLKQEVILLQVLSPDDLNPRLRGDLRLVDSETGEAREVTITAGLLKVYRRKLAEFTADIQGFCRQRGMSFIQLSSTESFEDVILRILPRAGVLG
ncbi:MAG: DUF58 domain-containing protein [Syntrophomonadaceae bacterium]|nr:DUF58 domain-containing protein [Syntrophomonadaceae bacterium]